MRNSCKFFERLWLLIFSTMILLLTGCERYALDRKMEQLCKMDGGVKVYETVKLSAAEFKVLLGYAATASSQESYYGPEYRYIERREILLGKDADLQKGRGQVARGYQAIYRKSDNRLL